MVATEGFSVNWSVSNAVTDQRPHKIKKLVAELCGVLGMDLHDPEYEDTPRRFTEYLLEFHQTHDFQEVLGNGFAHDNSTQAMVIQRDIPLRTACPHHLLPVLGTAVVAYIPHGKVVGLSKLTRLVQAVGTERPRTQENMTSEIAKLLNQYAHPLGVAVITKATHTCMSVRGVNAPGVETICSDMRGVFLTSPAARAELTNLLQIK